MHNAIDIARVCHEANRALQEIQADPAIPVAPPWDDATDEMRESAYQGVLDVIVGKTPAESHEAWCVYKIEHGWVYGGIKDENDKTHPCLVPYDKLSEDQRIKDSLFGAVVNALYTY